MSLWPFIIVLQPYMGRGFGGLCRGGSVLAVDAVWQFRLYFRRGPPGGGCSTYMVKTQLHSVAFSQYLDPRLGLF